MSALKRLPRPGAPGSAITLLKTAAILALALTMTARAWSQLAITEVMSAPKPNAVTGFRGAEYWELTNFGSEDFDLDGYSFRDGVASRPLVHDPFTNLVIRAGESIVFFRVADAKDSVTNVAQFRTWWGEHSLPADLRFRIWKSPGLSGWDGDAVVLFDRGRRLVDAVQFGRARQGRAFTYEPASGQFGIFSVAGVNGAFAAQLADDIGSPGTTTGPVPLQIVHSPADQIVDLGMMATFRASATGLPRPQYQWFFDGAPIPSTGGPELTLTNVQSSDAGEYLVAATNALSVVLSARATLIVETNASPPILLAVPQDTTVFERQTAVFTVAARGLPAPTFQWQQDQIDIPGATGARLELANVNYARSGQRFSVRIANALGSTNVSARLTVTRRPDLRFTEVMARPTDEEGNRHFDWFELTNFEPYPIDLTGWRFADEPSFARAAVITNTLILQPGESVVLAERLDERLFADWWGRDNLPLGFKIQTYSGFGLGYLGEQLFLWNAAAIDPNDSLATVSWAAATQGVSFECTHWCDPEGSGCLDEATIESAIGIRGAFRAVENSDLGSPGYVANPPLGIVTVLRTGTGPITVRCRVIPGQRYLLWRTASIAAPSWSLVTTTTAFNNVLDLSDPQPPGLAGFYRVEKAP